MQASFEAILGLITLLLTGLAWLIRLEAKVLYLEKDQKEHKTNGKEMWVKIDALQSTLNQVLQGVARLEGQMKK